MNRVTDRAWIARLNIEHYIALLATETDELKREMVMRMLVEEEAVLDKISGEVRAATVG